MEKIERDQAIKSLLQAHQIFKKIPEKEMDKLLDKSSQGVLKGGRTLIHQGELNPDFHLILHGHVQVIVRSTEGKEFTLRKLSMGDCFGFSPHLFQKGIASNYLTLDEVTFLKLDPADFKQFVQRNPNLVPYFKELHQEMEIIEFLSTTHFFEALPPGRTLKILENFEEFTHPPGKKILEEGSIGNEFYIIREGQVRVVKGGQKDIPEIFLTLLGNWLSFQINPGVLRLLPSRRSRDFY